MAALTRKQPQLRPADWMRDQRAIKAVRLAVFVQEQGIPESEEWDEMDAVCEHVLAQDEDGTPIATGRLAPDGKIGRMAVLKAWRGRGLGAALLRFLMESARRRAFPQCYVYAQSHASGFYARYGFAAQGEEFMEAGILHRRMQLRF
ncbi:MAG TPA: GNAT family N-acetyltransferase [Gammaproteobacteria bacterium]|nr:GNAT family N-acetyltransferase [Gammaproteobacteria bacterium]